MEQGNNPLENLKDIYLPDRVSALPQTYGWGLLLGLVLLIIVVVFIILKIRKNIRARKEQQVQDFANEMLTIQHSKPQEFVSEVSVYLKRVALHKFPKEGIKGLHGKSWLEFLDTKIEDSDFTQGVGQELANSYKQKALDSQKANELLEVAKKWLRAVL